MKIFFRVLIGSLLGLSIWTCDLTNSGPDVLNITIPDSMKTSAEKYDSVRLDLVTVKGTDTTLRQVLFHGEYENPAQLRKMPLVLSHKETFTVILKGYRKDALVLEFHLKFEKGKAGTVKVLLDIVPGSGGGNPPIVEGKTPVNTKNPTWTWKSGREGGSGNFRTSFKADMSAAVNTRELWFTASNLSEGTHTLYVQERDSLGNWSASGLFAVEVDLTPPNRPAMDSTPYSPLNSLRPKWNWKSGGNGGTGTYRVKVDDSNLNQGADTIAEGAYVPGKDLGEALHTLYVQERDAAGNWSGVGGRSMVLSLRGVVGKPGFSNESARDITISIAKSGIPYVAYSMGENVVPRVHRFRDGNWESLDNAEIYGKFWWSNAFALNASGIPYLAVEDADSSRRATVIRYSGSQWQVVGNPRFSEGLAQEIAIAINSQGLPYVAFSDGSADYKMTVMRLNGSKWDTVGNRRLSDFSPIHHCLAFDKSDTPYLAFVGNDKVFVKRFNAITSTWSTIGDLAEGSYSSLPISLAISRQDTLFIALQSNSSGGAGIVKKFVGSAWVTVGNPVFPGGAGDRISISFDNNGIPYVAFNDLANGERLTVMSLRQNIWTKVGIIAPNILISISSPTPIAINNEGVPYVAFRDEANDHKITVMKTSFDP